MCAYIDTHTPIFFGIVPNCSMINSKNTGLYQNQVGSKVAESDDFEFLLLSYVVYNALCEYKNAKLFPNTIHMNNFPILLMTICYPA